MLKARVLLIVKNGDADAETDEWWWGERMPAVTALLPRYIELTNGDITQPSNVRGSIVDMLAEKLTDVSDEIKVIAPNGDEVMMRLDFGRYDPARKLVVLDLFTPRFNDGMARLLDLRRPAGNEGDFFGYLIFSLEDQRIGTVFVAEPHPDTSK